MNNVALNMPTFYVRPTFGGSEVGPVFGHEVRAVARELGVACAGVECVTRSTVGVTTWEPVPDPPGPDEAHIRYGWAGRSVARLEQITPADGPADRFGFRPGTMVMGWDRVQVPVTFALVWG